LGGGIVIINDVTDPDTRPITCTPNISIARTTAPASRTLSRAPSASTRPHGACPDCQGLGIQKEIDPDLVVPNKGLSWSEGAIVGGRRKTRLAITGNC
jgi:excinuclease ABC subunit A